MKTENFFNKSRYGRISTKRKFNEEEQDSESSKTVIGNLKKKNKTKLSSLVSNDINENMRNGKLNEYRIGDIVWAKTGKYPVWPAIITNDPELKKFSKSKYRCTFSNNYFDNNSSCFILGENNHSLLHIAYCNDGFKRNWIKVNQISNFFGRNRILIENPKIMVS